MTYVMERVTQCHGRPAVQSTIPCSIPRREDLLRSISRIGRIPNTYIYPKANCSPVIA